MRTPAAATSSVFPGDTLTVDGDGVWVNNGSTTIGEIRFKHGSGTAGSVYFKKLVMNGGQLDQGDSGTVTLTGQMDARAIGFQQRGHKRKISTPFDMRSEECRTCGACIYICPACQLRCQGPNAETVLCNGCLTMDPSCLDHYEDLQCWMFDAGRCGTCVREKT